METYEGNVEDFTPNAAAAQDATLLVRFFTKPMPDKGKKLDDGRPIFIDREYVEIRVPGSRDAVARPATDRDRERFARHYAAYQQRAEVPLEGTPLAEWPLCTRSTVENLAFAGIKTVEQLAAVPDSSLGQFMGMGNLKRQAQAWLEDAKDDAAVTKITARLEQAEADVAVKNQTIADLSARLTELERRTGIDPAPATPVPDSPAPDFSSSLDGVSSPPSEEGAPALESTAPAEPSPARAARRRRRHSKE